jgi:hypothetical protein
MKLSHSSVTKIADALKPAIVEYLIADDRVTQALQDGVADGIREVMGDMDEDLFFEIGMLVFDRIEIK